LIPLDIPAWTVALQAVDRNPARIRPDLPVQDKGYAFPDPNSFATLPPAKQAQKICAWLSLHPATFARIFVQAGRKVPVGSGAVWRVATDFNQVGLINDNPAISNDKTTKAAKLRDTVRQLFGQELLARLRDDVEQVEWHEATLQVHDHTIVDLDASIVKEVIWELFKHNFRYEIVALDMAAAPSQWKDEESAVARRERIRQVFGRNGKFVIWSDPFPDVNTGLQSKVLEDKRFEIEQLRQLQISWPHMPPYMLSCAAYDCYNNHSPTKINLKELEEGVAKFYCQTFFDFFGRPPIVLHHMPLHADSDHQHELYSKSV
jgi:hypothetical protein